MAEIGSGTTGARRALAYASASSVDSELSVLRQRLWNHRAGVRALPAVDVNAIVDRISVLEKMLSGNDHGVAHGQTLAV